METFSALLALCAGNSPVAGENTFVKWTCWHFSGALYIVRFESQLAKSNNFSDTIWSQIFELIKAKWHIHMIIIWTCRDDNYDDNDDDDDSVVSVVTMLPRLVVIRACCCFWRRRQHYQEPTWTRYKHVEAHPSWDTSMALPDKPETTIIARDASGISNSSIMLVAGEWPVSA